MEIQLNTKLILEEVRQKSHLNTRVIQDPEARLNARIGEEQMDEVERCLLEANGDLKDICARWLSPDMEPISDDSLGLPEFFVYTFLMTPRRAANKGEALTQRMHEFLVSSTLERYYTTALIPDLAKVYTESTRDVIDNLVNTLHFKLPPR